jgi:hypothetical protein
LGKSIENHKFSMEPRGNLKYPKKLEPINKILKANNTFKGTSTLILVDATESMDKIINQLKGKLSQIFLNLKSLLSNS